MHIELSIRRRIRNWQKIRHDLKNDSIKSFNKLRNSQRERQEIPENKNKLKKVFEKNLTPKNMLDRDLLSRVKPKNGIHKSLQ